MRFSRRSLFSPGLLTLLLAVAGVLSLSAARQGTSGDGALVAAVGLSLEQEQMKADALVQVLPIEQVLGPLAPIALSPFFALTCLSGVSLAASSGLLPEALASNSLIGGGPLDNGAVFAGLLVLTLLTAAPKLTKVTKPFAQAVDQLENYSGIIAVLVIQALALVKLNAGEVDEVAVVYQAGIFTVGYSTLIMAFSVINLFVINAVKFFFEVLVLLSPIPVVDALFEAANKGFAAFLMAAYVFSPWLAMLLNVGIFLVCLVVFSWTYRRVVYMRSLLADPLFGWIAETVFKRPGPTLVSTPLPVSLARRFSDSTLVLKAFCGRSRQGLKRKMRGYLVQSKDCLYFAVPRLFRSPLIVKLPVEGSDIRVEPGLLCTTILLDDDARESPMPLLLTRRYNPVLNEIRKQIGAVFGEGKSLDAPSTPLQVSRSIGAAVRNDQRESLCADFA